MAKSVSEEDRIILNKAAADSNPNLVRLSKIDPLGRNPDKTLTELSNYESIIFSIVEGIHEGGIVELPATIHFFDLLRINRVPLNRKGIDEYLKAIIGQPVPSPQYAGMGSLEHEEKNGFLSRFRRN